MDAGRLERGVQQHPFAPRAGEPIAREVSARRVLRTGSKQTRKLARVVEQNSGDLPRRIFAAQRSGRRQVSDDRGVYKISSSVPF